MKKVHAFGITPTKTQLIVGLPNKILSNKTKTEQNVMTKLKNFTTLLLIIGLGTTLLSCANKNKKELDNMLYYLPEYYLKNIKLLKQVKMNNKKGIIVDKVKEQFLKMF